MTRPTMRTMRNNIDAITINKTGLANDQHYKRRILENEFKATGNLAIASVLNQQYQMDERRKAQKRNSAKPRTIDRKGDRPRRKDFNSPEAFNQCGAVTGRSYASRAGERLEMKQKGFANVMRHPTTINNNMVLPLDTADAKSFLETCRPRMRGAFDNLSDGAQISGGFQIAMESAAYLATIFPADELPASLDPINRPNEVFALLHWHGIIADPYAKVTWGIKPDPTMELAKKPTETDGHAPWEVEHLNKFFAHHKIGSKPYLAMMLLIHAAPRRADLVRLGPQHIIKLKGDEFIRFKPQKTARNSGVTVTMPLHPDLKAAIEATETGTETFLVTVFGKPYSVDAFSNHILDWRRAAGITASVSAHGMRKTVGINMAENEATQYELMAMLGHTNPKATEVYTRAANRSRLSTQAASKSTLSKMINVTDVET